MSILDEEFKLFFTLERNRNNSKSSFDNYFICLRPESIERLLFPSRVVQELSSLYGLILIHNRVFFPETKLGYYNHGNSNDSVEAEPECMRIFKVIYEQPIHINDICSRSESSMDVVSNKLWKLEDAWLIKKEDQSSYSANTPRGCLLKEIIHINNYNVDLNATVYILDKVKEEYKRLVIHRLEKELGLV